MFFIDLEARRSTYTGVEGCGDFVTDRKLKRRRKRYIAEDENKIQLSIAG